MYCPSQRVQNSNLIDNVAAVWHSATPRQRAAGADWHYHRHCDIATIARAYRKDIPVVAAMAAHLSCARSWRDTLISLESLAYSLERGRGVPVLVQSKYYKPAVMAWINDDPSVIHGPKVCDFRDLLIDPDRPIALVDRWNIRAAVGDGFPWARVSPKSYQVIAAAYHETAYMLGIPVTTLRATVRVAMIQDSRGA